MTLSAANPGGWSLNEVLTSVQMTFLQNELLKAIDGVNGGTYPLASALEFQGADVRFESEIELLSTSELNVNAGAALNIDSGATGTIDGDLTFSDNSDTTFTAGSVVDAAGTWNITGTIDIESAGLLQVQSGGRLDLNTGSEGHVEGTATLDIEGSGGLNIVGSGRLRIRTTADMIVEGGGEVIFQTGGGGGQAVFQSGAFATFQSGSGIFIEDANDIGINESNETWRSNMVPFGYITTAWVARLTGELVWEQIDVASDYRIVFPVTVPPGDDLVDVFVGLNGENGHGALPASMPVARIVRAALDGVTTTLATRTDQSANVAAYETPHYILLGVGSLDSGSMPIEGSIEPLYVIVSGETGANSIVGLEVSSISGNTTARTYRSDEAIYA